MTQSQQNYHYFNYSFELFNSLSVEELDAQNDWAVYWIMFNGAGAQLVTTMHSSKIWQSQLN